MKELHYRSFRHYLEVNQLLNATGEVLEKARQDWQRLYAKAYWSTYKKDQISFVLTKEDAKKLSKRAKSAGLKMTQYVVHLVQDDIKGATKVKPNLLVDIEIGLLETLDTLAKKMGASDQKRAELINFYQKLQELVAILTC